MGFKCAFNCVTMQEKWVPTPSKEFPFWELGFLKSLEILKQGLKIKLVQIPGLLKIIEKVLKIIYIVCIPNKNLKHKLYGQLKGWKLK